MNNLTKEKTAFLEQRTTAQERKFSYDDLMRTKMIFKTYDCDFNYTLKELEHIADTFEIEVFQSRPCGEHIILVEGYEHGAVLDNYEDFLKIIERNSTECSFYAII
ncbi:hypothetical protein OAP17_09345 [Porticoccaceae bacterium]|nr:hypothetical protein [Porticoccaceae bacterium]|tara:strand:+ start:29 stop:346 length:318 start_codon:yes stop_codon:yes gene_type:complete